MLFKLFILGVSGTAAASALAERSVCQMDNCLRALNSTNPKTRLAEAKQDCSTFFVKTITPTPETSTVYLTFSSTKTVEDKVTKTNTIHETITQTVTGPPENTFYKTTTTTITSTYGLEVSVDIGKREASPTIPAYASACSGVARYSTACSCIGVAEQTVTAPASTTTVTASTTSLATVHKTTVVATTDVVVRDSTVTKTVPGAPTTIVSTATATATVFRIGLDVEGSGPGFLSKLDLGLLSLSSYTLDSSLALTVTLQPDGSLWCGDKVAKADLLGLFPFVFADVSLLTDKKQVVCAIDGNHILTCNTPGGGGKSKVFGVEISTGIVLLGWLENLIPFLHKKATCKALPAY